MFESLPEWVNIALNWLGAGILWTGGIALIVAICVLIAYGVQAFIKRDDE